MRIMMNSGVADSLTYFYDADWAACPNIKRSVTGFLVNVWQFFDLLKVKKATSCVVKLS